MRAADFLPETPQLLQRMLPWMRIDVREEVGLGLLGRGTCLTGYRADRQVRHRRAVRQTILSGLDAGKETGAASRGGLRLPECGPAGGQRAAETRGYGCERADPRERGQLVAAQARPRRQIGDARERRASPLLDDPLSHRLPQSAHLPKPQPPA